MTTNPGHNNPPDAIELAQEPIAALGAWLHSNPVIEKDEQAREAKVLIDRVSEALREVEAERIQKVRPLNELVSSINRQYKAIHNTDPDKPGFHDKLLLELKSRLKAFMKAEERRREEALAEALKAKALAEQEARDAEAREKEAKADAAMGVETDVAQATNDADKAFSRFTQAARVVARAEKETNVKITGGFRGAVHFRTKEILVVEDYLGALEAMGMTPKVEEAILSSARDYRKVFGELPAGVKATQERDI